MKIIFFVTNSGTVINFRKELIYFLKERGHKIYIVSCDNKYEKQIIDFGTEFFCVPFDNRNKNIFKFSKIIKEYIKILREINPDVCLTFQLKPNILGPIACRKTKTCKCFSFVEGLGDPFQGKSLKGKIIKNVVSFYYRRSFRLIDKAFFLNKNDLSEFLNLNLIDTNKTILINGIGIDTSLYVPNNNTNNKFIVSMFSRLLINKGVFEYAELAAKVTSVEKNIEFRLYGEESQITKCDLKKYIDSGALVYCGFTNEPIEHIQLSSLIVSTSYREGFSRVILEAMALGKTVLASNVIGNNSQIINGENGFLCDLNNLDSFADKILDLYKNRNIIEKIGFNARKYCVENYDSKIINEKILSLISEK